MSTSAPNLASVDKVDAFDLLILRMVERVEYGVYRIELLSRNGSALNTIGRVSEVDVVSGEVIYGVNFDSDEYGKLMMTGLIYSQPICHAISAFHKAQIKI